MPMIDWQANCKDAMWGMFWVQQNHQPGAGADKEALKENVARLIRLTTQKTAGKIELVRNMVTQHSRKSRLVIPLESLRRLTSMLRKHLTRH